VFRRPIWEDDSVLHVDIYPFSAATHKGFHKPGLILWVNTLVQGFEGRYAAFRI
jgi:hypothetical protein